MSPQLDSETRRLRQEAILSRFAETGTVSVAAAGSLSLHYAWLRDDPEYARRFAEAEQAARASGIQFRKPHSRGYKVTGGKRAAERKVKQEALIAALRNTGIVKDAVRIAGTTTASYHAWCRDDQQFASRAVEALAAGAEARQRTMRDRLSTAARTTWTDQGRRDAQRDRQKTAWTPEMREAAAQRNQDRMADPQYREDWLTRFRASNEFRACANPHYFDEIDTPDKAYWLGFIATDGCVRGFSSGSLRLVIKLARKDRSHLVLLHEALSARRPIRDVEEWAQPPGSTERHLRPYSVLDVCSPHIVNALVGHGITPRKTDTLQPWDGPADLMPHYWRGVIDGDGTISIGDDDIKIGLCGSDVLVEAFREWAQSICGTTAKARQGKAGNRRYWLLYIGGVRQVPQVLAALYDDAPVALARKKALADLAVHGKPLQSSLF